MDQPDLPRLLEFQRLLLQFQTIERMVHIPPGLAKKENDAEHSYALAMLAWFLASHFPALNRDKVIRLALAHDIVEIHAGDTYTYGDAAHLAGKAERERAALEQLRIEWADFPELFESIDEYEALGSPEAKFVYALDKLQPSLIDFMNEGSGWKHLGITWEQFYAEKESKVPKSPEIYGYMKQLYELIEQSAGLFPASKPRT